MRLALSRCEIRSWRLTIWPRSLSTRTTATSGSTCAIGFPIRTRRGTAASSSHGIVTQRPETSFAIAVGGEAVGGIGFVMQHDVERVSAEIGYWLAEPFWGRGIVTEALVAVTSYAIADARLHAPVRAAVRDEPGVLPRARESRLRARGPLAPERDQGRQDHRSDAVRVYCGGDGGADGGEAGVASGPGDAISSVAFTSNRRNRL